MRFERTQRIAEEIKKTITSLLSEGKIKNTEILNTHALISIVAVDVVRDLKYAYVYVSVLGQGKQEILEALTKSSGFIRREVGKATKLRYTPEIIFKEDDSMQYASEISKKIDQVIRHDKMAHNQDDKEDNNL